MERTLTNAVECSTHSSKSPSSHYAISEKVHKDTKLDRICDGTTVTTRISRKTSLKGQQETITSFTNALIYLPVRMMTHFYQIKMLIYN